MGVLLLKSTSRNMGIINGKLGLKDKDVEKLSKSTGMTPEKVRQFFEEFVEKYPDGKMNKDQFQDFDQIGGGIDGGRDQVRLDKDELDFIFRIADEDNSGTINFMEFMEFLLMMKDDDEAE